MLCDELKRKYSDITGPYYGYNEVNEAIAELKAALKESEEARYEAGADAADYYQENRTLNRALWLARSRRAFAEAKYNHQISIRYRQHKERTIADCYDKEAIKWIKAGSKCRAKAEQYK